MEIPDGKPRSIHAHAIGGRVLAVDSASSVIARLTARAGPHVEGCAAVHRLRIRTRAAGSRQPIAHL